MDILLLVDPLYCARFWNPCFAPLIAPRITKLANMNFAVMPTVFSIPARPFPDVPRPLKEDRVLFKVGIPDENFWISAPKAPEDFWIAPDASDFTPEPTPEINFFKPPQPFEPIYAALLKTLPNTGICLSVSAVASFTSRIRSAVCFITAPAVSKLFPSESFPVYARSLSVLLNCIYCLCA